MQMNACVTATTLCCDVHEILQQNYNKKIQRQSLLRKEMRSSQEQAETLWKSTCNV